MSLIYLTIVPVVAYSVYVLYLLSKRDEYSTSQKKAQACLVIFLPIIGSIIVHGMIREFERIPKPRNPNDGQGVDGMPGGTQ